MLKKHMILSLVSPPLIITKEELDLALEKIRHVFQ